MRYRISSTASACGSRAQTLACASLRQRRCSRRSASGASRRPPDARANYGLRSENLPGRTARYSRCAAHRAPIPSPQMREHKAAATTAGVLYITGTVAGVLSKVVGAPVRDAGDPLAAAAEHSGAVVTSGLLVLVMGLSLAFIPVVLFPVLRRVDEVLAIGYLIVRGAVETACYVVIAIGWLMLAPLGEVMSAGPGTASPAGLRLGSLMIDSDATSAVCRRSCSALVPSSSTSCSTGRASSPAGSRYGVSWRSRSTWPPTCSRYTRSSPSTPPHRTCCSPPFSCRRWSSRPG